MFGDVHLGLWGEGTGPVGSLGRSEGTHLGKINIVIATQWYVTNILRGNQFTH